MVEQKKNKTILLVEDDEVLRYVGARYLCDVGYDVIVFPDTMKALKELDSGRPIDLAIVDVVMPIGNPHGVSFARIVHSKRPGTPIIFVTGYVDLAKAETALPGPVFPKPVDWTEIAEAIAAELGV
jgi:DNA-binding NtrC family response regulator